MIFCVRYLETLFGDRELCYAADLVRRIKGAELRVYLQEDRTAAALVDDEEYVDEVLSQRNRAVGSRVMQLTSLTPEQVKFILFRGRQVNFPVGSIAVGQDYANQVDSPGAHALVPAAEAGIEQRGGPLLIPFGNRSSGVLASRVGIRLAKALGKEVIFYHTTWKSDKTESDSPRDNMCPAAVEVMNNLEAATKGAGVSSKTIIEMAPDVTLGIRDCAGDHFASLIVCAYGRWKGGRGGGSGSHVNKLLRQSAHAMLIVQEEPNHE